MYYIFVTPVLWLNPVFLCQLCQFLKSCMSVFIIPSVYFIYQFFRDSLSLSVYWELFGKRFLSPNGLTPKSPTPTIAKIL